MKKILIIVVALMVTAPLAYAAWGFMQKDAEPEPAVQESTQDTTEPEPAVQESTQNATESEPVVQESTQNATESEPVVQKSTQNTAEVLPWRTPVQESTQDTTESESAVKESTQDTTESDSITEKVMKTAAEPIKSTVQIGGIVVGTVTSVIEKSVRPGKSKYALVLADKDGKPMIISLDKFVKGLEPDFNMLTLNELKGKKVEVEVEKVNGRGVRVEVQ